MPETLQAGALTTLERARAYLQITETDAGLDDMVVRLINGTSRQIERYCGRHLKSRDYTALVHDGSGSTYLALREWPLTQLTEIRERTLDPAQTKRVMDIEGWVVSTAGVLYLPADGFVRGWQLYEVDMEAGYKEGVHDDELAELEAAESRLLQVAMQDWHEKVGRGTTVSIGGESVSFLDKPLPEDVRFMLRPFTRLL